MSLSDVTAAWQPHSSASAPTAKLPFVGSREGSTARRTSLLGRAADALYWLPRLGFGNLLQTRNRRLRVSETVSLGDRRFLSIVEVDGVEYLIGGGSSSVALLTTLAKRVEAESFQGAVEQALQQTGTA